MTGTRPPVALTIAGSDSSGGAGIQADLKTFHALGVYGMSAITALTAQSTRGVTGIHAVPPGFVAEQIETTVADIRPDAVKTGMLANRAIVEVVAEAADRHGFTTFVVDPVMVATTGAMLLEDDAVDALLRLLVPRATILTPNGPEAAALTGRAVESPADQEAAARALVEESGAAAVLVKGGDLEGDEVVDVYFDGTDMVAFVEPRIVTTSTHGSGCALASAIAAWMAREEPLAEAVRRARAFVRAGIEGAPALGSGRGPMDLFPKK
ncbi:MAG TPA: bifunctional hydroxymethylpyrimidine kinase/phosphomethylpyrimidine kinase [Gemmatimonadota bacterium]|nr:bifunctional hydroxymethylpyrimidine kinase/phosphomethylpyrimidine kinase [Gemmatimonadota bacterium]